MTGPAENDRLGTCAAVVGAGMGGMMAAQALSQFFDRVVVLDKDKLPGGAEARAGAPQGNHVHALLGGGRRNLERLFPGLVGALIERGAVCSRLGTEFVIRDAAGWHPKRDIGLSTLTMSRPFLEDATREKLRANPKVEIRDETQVDGWEVQDGRVTGVTVVGAEGTRVIAADFFVDSSGRSSGSPAWLEAAGYGVVEETRLEIGTGYASAVFRKPPDWESAVDSVCVNTADPDTRGAFVFSVENDLWIASLTGRFDQVPSGDPDRFLSFAASLCDPVVHDWLSRGERVTPIKVYRAPVSRWRRYERLEHHPERLLAVGDAVAHVNPVFGQGMTLASAHVMGLLDLLSERSATGAGLEAIAGPHYQRVNAFTQVIWGGLEDVEWGFGGTKGERPADIDTRMAYSRGLRALMTHDPEVHRTLTGVGQLIDSPDRLGTPEVRARVMQLLQQQAAPA
jgi:2-polyprenyl-6-methoxyphenol hydroxylase-like FAD-dependent oxidoreductase